MGRNIKGKYSSKIGKAIGLVNEVEGHALHKLYAGFEKFDRWDEKLLIQEKLDGWYGVVIKENGKCRWEQGWEQYKALQALLPIFEDFMEDDSVITGEVGYGTPAETAWAAEMGYNRFIIFDCPRWAGKDISQERADWRFDFIADIWAQSDYWGTQFPQIALVKCRMLSAGEPKLSLELAWKFFMDVYDAGGEGAVLKLASGKYKAGKRDPEMWKIKKYVTKDYVLMGYGETNAPTYLEQGMTVANIMCGLYIDGKLKEVTRTSGFTFDMRRKFSDEPEKYIGKVVELGGFEIFNGGAMRHSMLLRFREDVKPEECTLLAGV